MLKNEQKGSRVKRIEKVEMEPLGPENQFHVQAFRSFRYWAKKCQGSDHTFQIALKTRSRIPFINLAHRQNVTLRESPAHSTLVGESAFGSWHSAELALSCDKVLWLRLDGLDGL